MKTRESGMPEEMLWQTFFRPDEMLRKLGLRPDAGVVVEFGCGYGTFTIPAAKMVAGPVHAFDIEPDMVAATRDKAQRLGLGHIQTHLRDFIENGTGLPDASSDYAMLFQILHAKDPGRLLSEAFRVLRPGGRLAIMHWNVDPATPRGPPMEMRPTPEQCATWAHDAGFRIVQPHIDLPPTIMASSPKGATPPDPQPHSDSSRRRIAPLRDGPCANLTHSFPLY